VLVWAVDEFYHRKKYAEKSDGSQVDATVEPLFDLAMIPKNQLLTSDQGEVLLQTKVRV
jgi:hypothetical protein